MLTLGHRRPTLPITPKHDSGSRVTLKVYWRLEELQMEDSVSLSRGPRITAVVPPGLCQVGHRPSSIQTQIQICNLTGARDTLWYCFFFLTIPRMRGHFIRRSFSRDFVIDNKTFSHSRPPQPDNIINAATTPLVLWCVRNHQWSLNGLPSARVSHRLLNYIVLLCQSPQ